MFLTYEKVNNAEIRAYYEEVSREELRERVAECGVSLPRDIWSDLPAMRKLACNTGPVWP